MNLAKRKIDLKENKVFFFYKANGKKTPSERLSFCFNHNLLPLAPFGEKLKDCSFRSFCKTTCSRGKSFFL